MVEVPNGYSRKLYGSLRTVLGSSPLIIEGGSNHGRKLGAANFDGQLPEIPSAVLSKPEVLARVNSRYPQAAHLLVSPENGSLGKDRYVNGVGGFDYQNIPDFALAMAQDNGRQTDTVIRIVYGATTEMPLRALSYLLPGLTFLDNIKSAGFAPPQLQVIFTNHMGARLNGKDLAKVQDQAQRFADFVLEYVQKFYPKLKGDVVFAEDGPFDDDTTLHGEVLEIADLTRRVARPELLEKLAEKGRRNGGVHQHFYYGAAHSIFHDTSFAIGAVEPYANQDATDLKAGHGVISIGHQLEDDFYDLRFQVRPHLPDQYQTPTLQYFTRHFVPPYFMARNGDLSLEDVLKGKQSVDIKVDPSAQTDLSYLLDVSSYNGDFAKFVERQRRKFKQ